MDSRRFYPPPEVVRLRSRRVSQVEPPGPKVITEIPELPGIRPKVASGPVRAVFSAILGGRPANVTDLYVIIPLEGLDRGVDRATLLVDGAASENVVPLVAPAKTGG